MIPRAESVAVFLSASLLCSNCGMSQVSSEPKSPGSEIPLVEFKSEAPTQFTNSGKTYEINVSAKEGASFSKGGVSIEVPAGAVKEDKVIKIVEFDKYPLPEQKGKVVESLPPATAIRKSL